MENSLSKCTLYPKKQGLDDFEIKGKFIQLFTNFTECYGIKNNEKTIYLNFLKKKV
jgi:hypothetical protein